MSRQGSIAARRPGHVVAEAFAEAARLQEIALHVDDEEGGPIKVHVDRSGLCLHVQ